MTTLLGRGLYTLKEAATLTNLKPSRVREWFRGRPVVAGDYEPVGGDRAISFHDLIDLYVAGQLREHGVSLQAVRKLYRNMQEDLDTAHPFCRKELLTDGKAVFLRLVDSEGQEELAEVLTKKGVFSKSLLPFLKTIDYDESGLARRWRIADRVVVDPAMSFGKPIVEAVGVPTSILAAAYEANQKDAARVARWYNVQPEHVMAAVAFEGSRAA